jgi:pimeloyl-ACP methyl ester carboxylesterase
VPDILHEQVLSGGRRLDVVSTGPTDGLTFVFHGGTPSAAVPFGPAVDAVTGRGLRYVTYSRPGYAGSDPHPGRTVADAAADVAAILDHLGAGTFVTAGWSGGGPHALACAALLPSRCKAAATIAGVAPYSAEGLDWLAGMGKENHEEFGVALRGEQPLTAPLGGASPVL